MTSSSSSSNYSHSSLNRSTSTSSLSLAATERPSSQPSSSSSLSSLSQRTTTTQMLQQQSRSNPLRRRTASFSSVNSSSSKSTSTLSSGSSTSTSNTRPVKDGKTSKSNSSSRRASLATSSSLSFTPATTSLLSKLSTTTFTSPSSPSPFPNELLLLIFKLVPTNTLLSVRRSSRSFRALVDVTLCERLRLQIVDLSIKHAMADDGYRETEKEKRPHLRHYRQFLRNITTNEITEATWYATPPEELKTVCECLCLLKGSPSFLVRKSSSLPNAASLPTLPSSSSSSTGDASSSSTLTNATTTTTHASVSPLTTPSTSTPPTTTDEPPMTWSHIKKTMTRYDFKTWLTNLRVGVDYIPFANIKRVERIIMMDPNVTYERLREVSMAGYKLLIIVAACLQYCAISEDLRVRRRDMVALEKTLARYRLFVDAADAGGLRVAAALKEVGGEDGEGEEVVVERTYTPSRPIWIPSDSVPPASSSSSGTA